jgi:hypothetical protein
VAAAAAGGRGGGGGSNNDVLGYYTVELQADFNVSEGCAASIFKVNGSDFYVYSFTRKKNWVEYTGAFAKFVASQNDRGGD